MRLTHSLLLGTILCLLTAPSACGQSFSIGDTTSVAPIQGETPQAQHPKLSPGAEEIARTIGVMKLIERFYDLPERERGIGGGAMSLEALSLRQQITESVVGAGLEVDGLITEIDSELAQISVVRSQLEAKRDRALAISNLATIVAGGATGVIGTAMQFSDGTAKAGNIIGVAGGAASTMLSLIGLRQQRGATLPLGVAPNMLAELFDRPAEFHSDYPKEVWTYLNAVPPTEPGAGTRRERLIKQWMDTGRIESGDTKKAHHKIELLTSGASDQHPLAIDLLNDRAAMLADVRVRVALMKRDLGKLLLALHA
jgi:hypothetical protein